MATLPLLRGKSISLEDALADDDNILHRLDYPQKQQDFWSYLVSIRADIEATVAFHLSARYCRVDEESNWMFGSYNVCIPVWINPPSDKRVLVRIPLPYKIGEETKPGNVDEKLRCETATYIWIRQNCPSVPIPLLHGFAFPDGQTVGYMIISYIESGRMLSDSWAVMLQDTARRQTLFNDLAKITLSLNRIQLPRTGSLTMTNEGVIRLTNRPLTLRLQTFENEGIPTIPRDSTYESVEPYLLDLLQCHDNRIHYQPNAIHDVKDGQEQLAALTMMRGLLPRFVSRQHRRGPFLLTLTDLHPSNIFVDEEWHITSLIDLEWACAFPIELQTPPYWLTGRPIDDIEHGEHLQMFEKVVIEYIDAFKKQEMIQNSPISYAQVLRECWNRGSFWYFQAVHSPKGLLRVFNEHVQRRFCEEHCTQSIFDRTVSPYWCVDAGSLIEQKVKEEEDYRDRLRKRFAS
ncbi:hypothetical protein BO79DRAFT_241647 [Aspergillus costaricaensis CBS 115574]|uniref:Uncharacterized protein n=1 Tax=Aspergillus costaricaensis CBS 115574 TaxID=1448317 RepID=A0ACD1IUN7_9EURO|nr:hypothetical protein BO79DRAFT_241647 [Aspergillus costaricaensis CBS 115574]RAK94065.1 hypothetical protein BO79DRAFT_241647 [Aspergillus costaricaensis CBS 115574]